MSYPDTSRYKWYATYIMFLRRKDYSFRNLLKVRGSVFLFVLRKKVEKNT